MKKSKDINFGNGIKMSEKLYTEEEVLNDKSADKATMSVDAIPDLELLLKNVIELVELMEQPDMENFKKTNNAEYEKMLVNKYQDCMPYNMIRLLLRDRHNNLEKVIQLIQVLSKVKDGKADLNEEYDKFGEKLNEEYLYPKFGGKEETFKFFTEQAKKEENN